MSRSWSRRIIAVGPLSGGRRYASLGLGAGGALAGGRIARGPSGPPVGRMPSIGVDVEQLADDLAGWTSWIDELVLMISRWARAGSASALMSSGMT